MWQKKSGRVLPSIWKNFCRFSQDDSVQIWNFTDCNFQDMKTYMTLCLASMPSYCCGGFRLRRSRSLESHVSFWTIPPNSHDKLRTKEWVNKNKRSPSFDSLLWGSMSKNSLHQRNPASTKVTLNSERGLTCIPFGCLDRLLHYGTLQKPRLALTSNQSLVAFHRSWQCT